MSGMAEVLGRVCPEFAMEGEPTRTGKGGLARGRFAGRPAFAKWLTLREEAWEERFLTEVDFYLRAAGEPAPVRVPRLLCGSRDDFVLVVEWLEGHALSRGRYLEGEAAPGALDALLEALARVHAWRLYPPPPAEEVLEEVEARVLRYVDAGYLAEEDLATWRAAAARPPALELSHGDPVLSNVLAGPGFGVALVDWEFAGWHLAGHDLAILWTLLQASPAARARVEADARVRYAAHPALFELCRLLAVGREIKIYEMDPDAAPPGRVAALRRDLEAVRAAARGSSER
jgi:hypothetical protein